MPQNKHDGNVDFKWNRGAVFTNKELGLWTPTAKVSAEQIKHMQSRCQIFRCTHVVRMFRPGGVPQCAHHLAQWVRDGAARFDANNALAPALRMPVAAPGDSGPVVGLHQLLVAARVRETMASTVEAEIAGLGAVDVRELSGDDWAALASWAALLEMERRRVIALVRQH